MKRYFASGGCVLSLMGLAVALWPADRLGSSMEERVDRDGDGLVDEIREITVDAAGAEVMKITKRDTDGDGRMDSVLKTIRMDGEQVFFETKSEQPAITTRSYRSANGIVMGEEDRGQDGVFETIVIYGEDHEIAGVLTRTEHGEIMPASPEKVAKLLRGRELFDQTVKPIMETLIEKAKENQKDQEAGEREGLGLTGERGEAN